MKFNDGGTNGLVQRAGSAAGSGGHGLGLEKVEAAMMTLHQRVWRRLDRLSDRLIDPPLDRLPEKVTDLGLELVDRAQRAVCLVLKHEPVGDQCGMPEHDYCLYCRVATPGQAVRS